MESNPFAHISSLGEGAEASKTERRNRRLLIGAAAIAASSAIHAPFAPRVLETYQETVESMHRPHVRPQSDADRAEVEQRVEARHRRIDSKDLNQYKEQVVQQLERGESIDAIDLVFAMEEKNGVPHEEVEFAKRAARADVERYVTAFGDDLDSSELDRFSREMYANADYVWGEASATDYYTKKKRNCVAITRVQQIVLASVMQRMSSETQKTWSLGSTFMDQHEILTASEKDPSTGSEKALWRIEDGAFAMTAGEQVGTATIGMEEVKKALVSSKPIEMKAKQGDGKTPIDAGVAIDAVTDEPARLNIHIEGKLRGSEWSVAQLQKEGYDVKPIQIPYVHEEGVMEMEFIDEERATPGDVLAVLEFERAALSDIVAGEDPKYLALGTSDGFVANWPKDQAWTEMSKWDNPTKEALEAAVWGGAGSIKEIRLRDPRLWDVDQFKAIFQNGPAIYHPVKILFELREDEVSRWAQMPESFYQSLDGHGSFESISLQILGGGHFTTEEFHRLLAHKDLHHLEFHYHHLGVAEIDELNNAPTHKIIFLKGVNLSTGIRNRILKTLKSCWIQSTTSSS